MTTITRGAMVLLATVAMPAMASANAFNIEAGEARRTVPIFAQQADLQVLASQSVLQGERTHRVSGEMTWKAALDRMIAGSALKAESSGPGTIVISRGQAATGQTALPAALRTSERNRANSDAGLIQGTGAEPAEVGSEEIIVTARRVEERLQDVPLAITAVQGEALAERGITQVMDLRQAVAGLNISSAAGRTVTPIYAIRGHRAADITVTQDPSVAIYVDDVIVTPLHGGNLGLFDLANVQVLKGPQGTLFGRNTTGGAVLFTTKKPTDQFEGYVKLGYGNYDTKTAQAAINLPVADWLKLRAAADYTKSDGFGRVIAAPAAANPKNLPQPGVGSGVRSRDELSLRLTSAIAPTDGVDITTTVYHSRANSGGPGFKLLNPPNPVGPAFGVAGQALLDAYHRQQNMRDFDVESTIDPKSRIRIFGVNNTITAKLSDTVTFKSVAGYRRSRFVEANDSDGSFLPILEVVHQITNINQYSLEPQMQFASIDGRLNAIVGLYYFKQTGFDFQDGNRTFGGAASIGGHIANSSFSGFGQATFAVTDTLNVTGGFRYSIDRRKFELQNFTGSIAAPGTCNLFDTSGNRLPITACVIPVRKSFAKPSWLISIDKKFGPDTLVYLSHRRGYRSGGFSLRAFDRNSLRPFAPETVSDVELGLKSTTRFGDGWSLRTNLAGYYQWYNDVQRSQVMLVNLGGRAQQASVLVNAAKAHIFGGEAEFELRSGRFFSFSANYAYVRPKYDNWPILATIGGVPARPTNYSNRQFANISRHQFNATARISPDIGDMGELNLIGNFYYQSRYVFADDIQNQAMLIESLSPAAAAVVVPNLRFSEKGYALVNLRAELNNIAGSGFSAAVWAKNVFDKRYIGAGNIFYGSLGIDRFTYGDPRTYGAEVSFRF